MCGAQRGADDARSTRDLCFSFLFLTTFSFRFFSAYCFFLFWRFEDGAFCPGDSSALAVLHVSRLRCHLVPPPPSFISATSNQFCHCTVRPPPPLLTSFAVAPPAHRRHPLLIPAASHRHRLFALCYRRSIGLVVIVALEPQTLSSTVSTTSMFPTSHPFHNSHSSDRCTRELWRWRSLHLFYDSIPCIISHTEYKFRKNLPNLPRRWACTYERINELTNQGATGQRYGAPK